jgi:hypothetical protein
MNIGIISMNRRSMLGFLGIGAAGVSTLGSQGSVVPSDSLSYGISGKYDAPISSHISSKDHAVYLKDMQEQLSVITGDPSKWIADKLAEELKDWRMGYSSTHYSNIDPDIRNMKSITEAAKMRMYFERKVKRQMEISKQSLSHRIAEYMGLAK